MRHIKPPLRKLTYFVNGYALSFQNLYLLFYYVIFYNYLVTLVTLIRGPYSSSIRNGRSIITATVRGTLSLASSVEDLVTAGSLEIQAHLSLL